MLKKIIKTIIPKKFIKFFVNKRIEITWYLKNKPIPPPPLIKQKIVKSYAKEFTIKVFIESGTYLGDMVNAVKDKFDKIISIELDKNLYKKNKEKFSKFNNIKIILGDSGEVLPKILAQINQKCLFWLDGHYSHEITAKGTLNTPIIKELESILNHKIKGHIILIDDARCFIGKDDYPTIQKLKEFINDKNSNLSFRITNDIIVIS
jgi:hypothetical protein